MKLLKKIWNWVRIDGLVHIETSGLIVIGLAPFMPLLLAILISFVMGIAREFYNFISYGGTTSWKVVRQRHLHDLICNIIGIAFASVFAYFFIPKF